MPDSPSIMTCTLHGATQILMWPLRNLPDCNGLFTGPSTFDNNSFHRSNWYRWRIVLPSSVNHSVLFYFRYMNESEVNSDTITALKLPPLSM